MARRRSDAPNALVAAAKKIRIGRGAAAQDAWTVRQQEWQGDAWVCFDEVPEVKHGILFAGNAMSKLRLFVAVRPKDDPDGEPVPVGDPRGVAVDEQLAADARAELDRLSLARGGRPEVQRVLTMCLEVGGIAYLVGHEARETVVTDRTTGDIRTVEIPESWEVRSDREVEIRTEGDDRVSKIRGAPGAKQVTLDEKVDTITAIWQRHAAWSDLPDSNMRAAITDCRALQLLTGQVLAEAASAMPAQAFTVPNELTFSKAPAPTADGEPDPADPLDVAIDQAWTEAVEDPMSMSVYRPFVIRGPAEYLKADYLRVIDFKRGGGADLESRIVARVNRLARGLNMPVEVVLGHQGTTFANAEQVDQDTWEDYLQPRGEMLVESLTTGFLHANLTDPERPGGAHDRDAAAAVFIWYDAARLVAQPDPEKHATEAWDRGEINGETFRRALGFSEDDKPTIDELLVRMVLRRGILTADLSRAMLEQGLGVSIDVAPIPAAPPADGTAPAEDPAATAGILELLTAALGARPSHVPRPIALAAVTAGARRPEWGRRLLDVDRFLRARVQAAAESSLDRALERAGNRLRGRSVTFRQLTDGVDPRRVAAHLGEAVVTADGSPGDLVDGAFDALHDQFMEWGGAAQAEALDLVGRIVGGFDVGEREALGLRQAGDLDTAWSWLEAQLRSLATARLFNPDPNAPDVGEFDPTARVPTGMVRQAIARAGGSAHIATDGQGGAFVTVPGGGQAPVGGVATGELAMGALQAHGALVEAYQWVYGPARRSRPFEPHMDLDGVVFANFDDPILANGDSFPLTGFYMPGDHDGCVCDAEPVVVPPEDLDE